MKNVIRPTEQELIKLYQEQTASNSAPGTEFVENYLSNLAGILKGRPKVYRSYGPYWWPIKALLIEQGYEGFGENIEAGTVSAYRYDDAAHTCIAAWAYHTLMLEEGLVYSSEHVAPTEEDADYPYQLHDLDMEALII